MPLHWSGTRSSRELLTSEAGEKLRGRQNMIRDASAWRHWFPRVDLITDGRTDREEESSMNTKTHPAAHNSNQQSAHKTYAGPLYRQNLNV